MTEEKKVRVIFAPGAFDQFEGTQEELDEFIAEIKNMFEGNTHEEIKEMSRVIDFEDPTEEDLEAIIALSSANTTQNRTLQ
jgi:CheY-specific phosphatase CheX